MPRVWPERTPDRADWHALRRRLEEEFKALIVQVDLSVL